MSLPRRPKSVAYGIERRAFVLLLGAFASCALSGCSFLQPHDDLTRFYVLTVPSAPSGRATQDEFKRWKVGLRPVEMPGYLQSKSMVVRSGTNEIHFADFDRWAEPLDQGISRVIKETLSGAPNVETVTLTSHGDDTLDYEVAVRLLACEGVRVAKAAGTIRFAVTWEVRSVGKTSRPTKRGVFTAVPVAWDGKDYGQLAQRLSEAIAGASNVIAADLALEVKAAGKP
jgi:uncharacterized lipoprotein YmbA